MVVALATFERRAEPDGSRHIHAVNDLDHTVFLFVGPRFDVDGRATVKAGGDDLVLEGDIRNLLVVLGDSQIAQIWSESKTREQLLLK